MRGPRQLQLTPRLRFSRCAPSALRAHLPLSRQLRLIVKRTEWQLPRQSGFAGTNPVADANYTWNVKGKSHSIASFLCLYCPQGPYLRCISSVSDIPVPCGHVRIFFGVSLPCGAVFRSQLTRVVGTSELNPFSDPIQEDWECLLHLLHEATR